MKSTALKVNTRRLVMTGFLLTLPSLFFWCLVIYTKIFHHHELIDIILSSGGTFCDVFIKGVFPFASLCIAVVCHKALQQEAMEKNVFHRETPTMRLNRVLINWNAVLILVMIVSFINN